MRRNRRACEWTAVLLVILAACGSDDSGTPAGTGGKNPEAGIGGTGGGSAGTGGGAAGQGGGTAGLGGGVAGTGTGGGAAGTGRNAWGECPGEGSGGQGGQTTCTGEDAYDQCVITKCDAKAKECFGDGYASGTYGGTCGPTITCVMACKCGDSACELACMTSASSGCATCADEFDKCVDGSGCPEPVCGTGGAGGGSEGGTAGSAAGAGGGGTVCPYSAPSLDCGASCDNLKSIAAKCKDDPSLSDYTKAALQAAATGSGTLCKSTCAADSPGWPDLWSCFQAVPVAADCTAVAGCNKTNCPQQ